MRRTLIITPAGGSCNLQCDYCYNRFTEPGGSVMNQKVLRRLIETAFFENTTRFVWHGGEPLMAGKPFFREAVHLQEIYGKGRSFVNCIQTNCTLIDQEWAKFLVGNNFYVSTSVDGDEELHNLHRKKRNQAGSYREVMREVELLHRAGCERVGAVLVINKDNVKYPERVFDEMTKSWKAGFEPNPCFGAKKGDDLFTPANDDLLKFLTTIFDLWWEKDDPIFHIRLFKDIIRVLLGGFPLDCTFKIDGCRHITAIDEKGDVYVCSRFIKEPSARLGNVMEADLGDIVNSRSAQSVYDRLGDVSDDCRHCEWLKFCGGGCAYQRWLAGDLKSRYYACEVRKRLFAHVTRRVTKEVKQHLAQGSGG